MYLKRIELENKIGLNTRNRMAEKKEKCKSDDGDIALCVNVSGNDTRMRSDEITLSNILKTITQNDDKTKMEKINSHIESANANAKGSAEGSANDPNTTKEETDETKVTDDDEILHCFCRMPEFESELATLVQCGHCSVWYHPPCMNLTKKRIDECEAVTRGTFC